MFVCDSYFIVGCLEKFEYQPAEKYLFKINNRNARTRFDNKDINVVVLMPLL